VTGQPARESCRRRAHEPAGRLLWEDARPREIGRGALEDLVFQLKVPVLAPQHGQLLFSPLVSSTRLPLSSAWAIQFRGHDLLMPRSLAILATGAVPQRASSTARCRNSGGCGAGMRTSFPMAEATSGQVSGSRGASSAHLRTVSERRRGAA
jgi:hypothetical protein